MSRTYFTSDIHLYHLAMQYLRGYDSDVEQFDALRESWSRVTKRDVVWILGDLNLSRLEGTLRAMNLLAGTKHLVFGNHDAGHPIRAKTPVTAMRYLDAFASVSTMNKVTVEGEKFLLSHFPYDGEGDRIDLAERHTQWRPRDLGVPLIHGHTHSPGQFSLSQEGTPMLHVGLDAWPNLVRSDELMDVLRSNT